MSDDSLDECEASRYNHVLLFHNMRKYRLSVHPIMRAVVALPLHLREMVGYAYDDQNEVQVGVVNRFVERTSTSFPGGAREITHEVISKPVL